MTFSTLPSLGLVLCTTVLFSQVFQECMGQDCTKDNTVCPDGTSCVEKPGTFCIPKILPDQLSAKCLEDNNVGPACVKAPETLENPNVRKQTLTSRKSKVKVTIGWGGIMYDNPMAFMVGAYGTSPYGKTHSFFHTSFETDVKTADDMEVDINLYGGWNFEAYLVQGNALGNTNKVGPIKFVTKETVPEKVENVRVSKEDSVVVLSFKCPVQTGGSITNIIIKKEEITDNKEKMKEFDIPTDGNCLERLNSTVFGGVQPGATYRFQVKLKNSEFTGSYTAWSGSIKISDSDGGSGSTIKQGFLMVMTLVMAAMVSTI